jgi:CBS domain containing-hemolysin-like protein
MGTALEFLVTILLIIFNGFFVAAEFAMVRLRKTQIEAAAKAGDDDARAARDILSRLQSYLSATQVGITLSSLGLGWIGEPLMARMLLPVFRLIPASPTVIFSISFAVGFIILTSVHIVIGEQIPKSLAITSERKVALRLARPLMFFYRAFQPLIWFLNMLVGASLKILGIPQVGGKEGHTREELRTMIIESEFSGAVNEEESDMIQSLFGFRETTVREVMVHRSSIIAIDLKCEPKEIMQIIEHEGFSRLPVYKTSIDEIVGILNVKKLLGDIAQLERLSTQQPTDEFFTVLMKAVKPALIVSETQRISSLLVEFQRTHNHMAVVVSEHGGTEGIVTLEDVLEELVGEIQDESDTAEERDVIEVGDALYVDATMSVSEFNERYGDKFGRLEESAEYQTISGYVQKIAGRIPNIGDSAQANRLKFTVTRKIRHKLQQIKIERVAVLAPAGEKEHSEAQ